jgi:serine/threonine protein kinase
MSESRTPTQRFDLPERYRWIAHLGEGGMAQVCLAYLRGNAGVAKLVVIKRLRADLAGDPQFTSMFVDEARLAALLNHQNVVHTYDVVSEGDSHFLVMEYLAGQSLSALYGRLGRAGLPRDMHLHILSEVLAGLEHAHDLCDMNGQPLGVVHRDVSPQNVMITYEGQVKLVDFGIAKAAGAATVTQTGAFKGKLAYSAPEQIAAEHFDRRADLFAVGVLLWEALAGRRINEGRGESATLRARLEGTEPHIAEIAKDVPPDLAAICDRALSLRPDDRFPNASEMKRVLDAHVPGTQRERQQSLARLMSDTFSEARSESRRAIEVALKDGPAKGSASTTGATPASSAKPLELDVTLGEALRSPNRRKPNRWLVPALAILAIGAIGVAIASRSSRGGDAPTGASSGAASASVASNSTAAATAPSAAVPSATVTASVAAVAPTTSASPAPSTAGAKKPPAGGVAPTKPGKPDGPHPTTTVTAPPPPATTASPSPIDEKDPYKP